MLIMTLKDLRDALVEVTPKTYHYSASGAKGNYIVWAEEGQGDVETADDKSLSGIVGTIIYYTETEFDTKFDEIQIKLNSVDVAWSLESITYDESDDYIIYIWTFEIGNTNFDAV